MQEDRAGNVAGEEAGAPSAPERSERTERELELAAKSLRAREPGAPSEGDPEPSEEGDVDRGA